MSGDQKSDEIIVALEKYVERQKKVIAEENQRLLSEGQDAFERILAEKRNATEEGTAADQATRQRLLDGGKRSFRAVQERGTHVKQLLKRFGIGAFGCLKRWWLGISAGAEQLEVWLRRARNRHSS